MEFAFRLRGNQARKPLETRAGLRGLRWLSASRHATRPPGELPGQLRRTYDVSSPLWSQRPTLSVHARPRRFISQLHASRDACPARMGTAPRAHGLHDAGGRKRRRQNHAGRLNPGAPPQERSCRTVDQSSARLRSDNAGGDVAARSGLERTDAAGVDGGLRRIAQRVWRRASASRSLSTRLRN